jgi:hypothetical protein
MAMAEVAALLLTAKIASVLQVPSIQLASDCLGSTSAKGC